MSRPLSVPDAVERVRARDPRLHAFIRTRLDEALADHRRLTAEPPRSPLHGLPYALKDMWDTLDLPTSGGSARFRDRRPDVASPVRAAFDDAGAVLLGKTNLSDLALVPESASWVGGVTVNPHDPARTAGGSSGGAAAAVADGMIEFDWGSDFGGSIRIPAAFCGVYGMRLSTETWPVRGMFPSLPPSLAPMNGQGPITRSLDRMRDVLRAAAPRLRARQQPFSPRGVLLYPPDRRTAGAWPRFSDDATRALAPLGEVRRENHLPPPSRIVRTMLALLSSHLEDLASVDPIGIRSGVVAALSAIALRGRLLGDHRFHPYTAQLLLVLGLGRITLFRDRARARTAAGDVRDRFRAAWDAGLLVATPTCTWPAPRHGRSAFNPWLLAHTIPGNLADATCLALPFGQFPDGLPRSLQLLGPPGSEDALLDAARRVESPES